VDRISPDRRFLSSDGGERCLFAVERRDLKSDSLAAVPFFLAVESCSVYVPDLVDDSADQRGLADAGDTGQN